MTGAAFVIILVGMAGSWGFRALLLRTLRERHPDEFAALGRPSTRQLDSVMPRNQNVQLQFWHYLWDGKVFEVNDRLVTGLGRAALISDVALVAGVAVLFWSMRG